jgi:electron transport complex protein RnfC
MTGRPLDLDTAIVDATTAALTILPAGTARPYANDPCISCGRCVDICPMGLQPQLFGRNAEFGFFDRNRALDVDRCIRCGLCAWACVSGRPLVQWIELTVAELAMLDARTGSH